MAPEAGGVGAVLREDGEAPGGVLEGALVVGEEGPEGAGAVAEAAFRVVAAAAAAEEGVGSRGAEVEEEVALEGGEGVKKIEDGCFFLLSHCIFAVGFYRPCPHVGLALWEFCWAFSELTLKSGYLGSEKPSLVVSLVMVRISFPLCSLSLRAPSMLVAPLPFHLSNGQLRK